MFLAENDTRESVYNYFYDNLLIYDAQKIISFSSDADKFNYYRLFNNEYREKISEKLRTYL